jgi:hypothetical protein
MLLRATVPRHFSFSARNQIDYTAGEQSIKAVMRQKFILRLISRKSDRILCNTPAVASQQVRDPPHPHFRLTTLRRTALSGNSTVPSATRWLVKACEEVMEHLFEPHFATWVWLHDVDLYWIEPMSTTHPTAPEAVPLHYVLDVIVGVEMPRRRCRGARRGIRWP